MSFRTRKFADFMEIDKCKSSLQCAFQFLETVPQPIVLLAARSLDLK